MPEFEIRGRMVGPEHPPLVIAEIGINHGGSLDLAIAMADAAIGAGAEIIKHQTHIPSDEMSDHARSVKPANADVSIYDVIASCSLGEDEERQLMRHIESRGAIFLSTPFSRAAADRLADFDVGAYKIGSGECNNYPLIRHICRAGKPIILSTGMNTIESVKPSIDIIRSAGVPYALLHCTNIYPTPHELVRLKAMDELSRHFPDAVIGLSDHTTSNYTCLGAVALGASILERHFTDSMSRIGPDIVCSMDPVALADLIRGSRIIFEAMGGSAVKEAVAEEAPTIAFAFASVVAIQDIPAGGVLGEDNVWLKRPSGGDFSAADFDGLIGKRAARAIVSGAQLSRQDLEPERQI
jgi:N-acetylneuraminate synthase